MLCCCANATFARRCQALVAAIRGRGQQASSFIDALEAKYGGAQAKPAPKRGGKRSEPSDADFAATEARSHARRTR